MSDEHGIDIEEDTALNTADSVEETGDSDENVAPQDVDIADVAPKYEEQPDAPEEANKDLHRDEPPNNSE